MIADVDADLLQSASRRKRRNRIDKRPQTRERQAGGHAGHVGLGNPAVVEAIGGILLVLVEETIPDVSGEEHHARVAGGKLGNSGGKGISHGSPNSFRANFTSSAVGIR